MTSDRPYCVAGTVEAALAELSECAGTQFDPAVVKAFRAELAALGARDSEGLLELGPQVEQPGENGHCAAAASASRSANAARPSSASQ